MMVPTKLIVDRKKASKVEINVFQNNTLSKAQDFKVKGNITYFDISPDHKKIAFVSRGELFVSDLKRKFIRVDGSSLRLSSWGCYTISGENLEKEGVRPDIYIKETFENRLKGQQPQLDKAIEGILNDL